MTFVHDDGPNLFELSSTEGVIGRMPDGVPFDVCVLFERLALEVRASGLERYSARAILHRMRWHYNVERGDRDFKINNKHSAPLARWFLVRHPDLEGFFETRESGE